MFMSRDFSCSAFVTSASSANVTMIETADHMENCSVLLNVQKSRQQPLGSQQIIFENSLACILKLRHKKHHKRLNCVLFEPFFTDLSWYRDSYKEAVLYILTWLCQHRENSNMLRKRAGP
jgi:hypothetical protein